MTNAGVFIAVVGPSGAGKDTIMDHARLAFADDQRVHFVRRVVTRPATAGAEDHDCLDEAGFLQAIDEGRFALHWQAHGLSYGLPTSMNDDLERGCVVIANVSRKALSQIRQTYPTSSIIQISATPDVLALRLAARGRETAEDIEQRLARHVEMADEHDGVFHIDNSGAVDKAANAFIEYVRKIIK